MSNESELFKDMFEEQPSAVELLEIIKKSTPKALQDYVENLESEYLGQFSESESESVVGEILQDPENWYQDNWLKLRRGAFLAYAKMHMYTMDTQDLDDIVNTINLNDLKASSSALPEVGTSATSLFFPTPEDKKILEDATAEARTKKLAGERQDLFGGGVFQADIGFFQHFRAIAAVEQIIRDAKNRPTANQQETLDIVNNLKSLSESQQILVASLSDEDQYELQTQIAVVFVKKYSAADEVETIKNLLSLTLANNLPEFKERLAVLGIDAGADWVDPKAMPAIQKAASLRTARMYDSVSNFGLNERPRLVQFAKQLLTDKQQLFLAAPEMVFELMQAKDSEKLAVEYPDINARELIAENERLEQLSKIHNAGIARILAKSDLPFLSNGKINEINHILLEPSEGKGLINQEGQFAVDQIINTVKRDETYQAKIENNLLNAFSADSDIKFTKAQHDMNRYLTTRRFNADGGDRVILDYFLTLEKKNTLLGAEVEHLLRDFKAAESRDDFLLHANTYQEQLARLLDFQLTPEIFNKLKLKSQEEDNIVELENQQEDLLFSSDYKDQLGERKASLKELDKIFDKVRSTDAGGIFTGGMRKELVAFKEKDLQSFEWMAGNAAAISRYLHPIVEDLDTITTEYKRQEEVYEAHLKALPTKEDVEDLPKDEKRRAADIEKFRSYLEKGLQQRKAGLSNYAYVNKLFHGPEKRDGNPEKRGWKQDGVMETLKKIENGQGGAIQFRNFTSTFRDVKYEIDPKTNQKTIPKELFAGGGATKDIYSQAEFSQDAPSVYYQIVKPIAANSCREHTVSLRSNEPGIEGQEIGVGRIIEELNPPSSKKAIDSRFPPVRMTASQYPHNASPEAKAIYSLAFISQTLANGFPSEKNPLVLKGSNGQEVAGFYAAALFVGIDEKAIKTSCKNFHPKTDAKWVKELLKDLKKYQGTDALYRKGIEELRDKRDPSGEIPQKVDANISQIGSTLKKMKGTIQKIRDGQPKSVNNEAEESPKNSPAPPG